jgi:hypothetical protein
MISLGTEQEIFRRQEMREDVAEELETVAMRRSGDGKTRKKLAEGANSERGK